MTYEEAKSIINQPLIQKIKDETKEYHGFTFILSFIKATYGVNVYAGHIIQDKLLSDLNELIREYNSNYTETKWITKDIQAVCDPSKKYKCYPKVIFQIKDIPPLDGRLSVKNKMVELCGNRCGPDCVGSCFFVPQLTDPSLGASKYFKDTVNTCHCIPCYDYITTDGDIKCFQKDVMPSILQILLDNFKKIYAASNDRNPRTAYYIFSDTFSNESDVKDDIRKMCNDLQNFIHKCRNTGSSDVQSECAYMKKTKTAADSSCINGKKMLCSNVDPDIPNTDINNCINKKHTLTDVIRDNINYYLKPTISTSCHCSTINPVDGSNIDEGKMWMPREKCAGLNDTSSNFHVCSDDSYSMALINHIRDTSSEVNPDNGPDNGPEIYDSYTFDFTYTNEGSTVENCDSDTCLDYTSSGDKTDTTSSGDETDYDTKIKKFKGESEYRHVIKNYCKCIQPDPDEMCNTTETCFGVPPGDDGPVYHRKCSDVHSSLIDMPPESLEWTEADISLAKNYIIDRDVCEQKLRCMGYVCDTGGEDNPYGSAYTNEQSYLAYARDLFHPLIPSYTGISLNYTMWDQITIPGNSNDQKVELSMKPIIKALTGGESDDTLSSYVSKQLCNSGNVVEQYSAIDKNMAALESAETEKARIDMWQTMKSGSLTGCIGGFIESAAKAATVDLFSSKKMTTPKDCTKLSDQYTSFLTDISKTVTNTIDATENTVVAGALGAVAGGLKSTCRSAENNRGYEFEYSGLLGYVTYALYLVLLFGVGLFAGPLILVIAGILYITGWIYDKLVPPNVLGDSDSDGNFMHRYVIYIIIILSCAVLLKATTRGRRVNTGIKNVFRSQS